jgi:hypothetical protein
MSYERMIQLGQWFCEDGYLCLDDLEGLKIRGAQLDVKTNDIYLDIDDSCLNIKLEIQGARKSKKPILDRVANSKDLEGATIKRVTELSGNDNFFVMFETDKGVAVFDVVGGSLTPKISTIEDTCDLGNNLSNLGDFLK